MKYLDLNTWKRKNQYELFKEMDYPHFNICANVDITKFYNYIKANQLPFLISMVYVVSKATNDIEEFKYRMRDNKVVIHEKVSPAFTIMSDDEVFGFCPVEYEEDYQIFLERAKYEIQKSKEHISVEDEPNKDDMIYLTSIPWVSFTAVQHPIHMSPVDSIPRIAWGKYFEENGIIKIPVSVQAHHSMMDGLHVGKYFMKLQEILNNPQDNIKIN